MHQVTIFDAMAVLQARVAPNTSMPPPRPKIEETELTTPAEKPTTTPLTPSSTIQNPISSSSSSSGGGASALGNDDDRRARDSSVCI
jgi:hypothetical protein